MFVVIQSCSCEDRPVVLHVHRSCRAPPALRWALGVRAVVSGGCTGQTGAVCGSAILYPTRGTVNM